ncbi:SubName: Full=Uncharacterized protein {ECO:0000313/EMBL:CCA73545.1} [Serendipita indica DSM 11827]|nr:SubName: Full=Uncharacterized protein {ECO:0000313/EMBL:CCA73545.1} [Serendipita indica DSM 11827]
MTLSTDSSSALTQHSKDPSTGTEGEGASAAITLTVDETNMSQIRKLKGDPVAMWNKLESIHNAKTSATRFNALEAFFTKTKAEGEPLVSITAATNALEEQFRSLWTTDYDVDALLNDLAMMSSLRMIPPESIHVRTSLLCQPNLTRDVIDAALVNEDNQQRRNSQPAIALRPLPSPLLIAVHLPTPHDQSPRPLNAHQVPYAIIVANGTIQPPSAGRRLKRLVASKRPHVLPALQTDQLLYQMPMPPSKYPLLTIHG